MNKQEFLDALGKQLSGFPPEERDERLSFYAEMIDDRMEAGLSEADAVKDLGTPEAIAEQILKETPLITLAKKRMKPSRSLKAWEIVLLVLGSPIWLSLLIAAFAVALSLYAVLWSGIVSLWAVFAAAVGSAVGCTAGGILFSFTASLPVGLACVGAGIFASGLAIFLFFGCQAATRGILLFTRQLGIWTKRLFLKKEEA